MVHRVTTQHATLLLITHFIFCEKASEKKIRLVKTA